MLLLLLVVVVVCCCFLLDEMGNGLAMILSWSSVEGKPTESFDSIDYGH